MPTASPIDGDRATLSACPFELSSNGVDSSKMPPVYDWLDDTYSAPARADSDASSNSTLHLSSTSRGKANPDPKFPAQCSASLPDTRTVSLATPSSVKATLGSGTASCSCYQTPRPFSHLESAFPTKLAVTSPSFEAKSILTVYGSPQSLGVPDTQMENTA